MLRYEKLINGFIDDIKNVFGTDLIVGYEYIEELGLYNIWHNDMELDFNESYLVIIDGLIRKHFKDFYDFSFAYDFDKANAILENSKQFNAENSISKSISYELLISRDIYYGESYYDEWGLAA